MIKIMENFKTVCKHSSDLEIKWVVDLQSPIPRFSNILDLHVPQNVDVPRFIPLFFEPTG